MAPLIGAEGVHLAHPDRVLLDSITLGVSEGDRIGVVGRNGDGKSTLLRILARRLEPDDGRITWRRDLRVGYLEQTDSLDSGAAVVATIVGERPEHEWAGDPRIRDVLDGLISDVALDARIGDLSGGQRRRVALAQVLVGEHDVVFLDEPTNHLDIEGVTWLARHVRASPVSAYLIVTHDRWFLDEVSTSTLEVHDGVVDAFEGGYAAYVLQRVERDRQAAASETKRQNLMRKELAWLRRGAPARTSKPKFRIDAANALIEREPPVRNSVELAKLATARLGKDVVDLLDVSVSYGEREVLHHVEWRIAPGERAGILGVNGAGKSTLLGLVTGEVQPTAGRVKRGKTIKVATLSQSLAELDDVADDRITDLVSREKVSHEADGRELSTSQLLEQLGFGTGQLSTRIKDLSGGQRRRLQLLMVLLGEPNVLILDEPTNDLDTDMLAAMEDLLDTWPGTLLVVSHDRYLLERVTDVQYAVVDGGLRHLPGGVDEYLRLSTQSPTPASVASSVAATATAAAAAAASTPAAASAMSGKEREARRKEIARIERQLDKLTAREAELEAAMAEFATDPAKLVPLAAEHTQAGQERSELEERWLELHD